MAIGPMKAARPEPPQTAPAEPDPSMDDILASIRRILSDEERAGKPPPPTEDVLKLDPSMMLEEPSEPTAPEPHEIEHAPSPPSPPPLPIRTPDPAAAMPEIPTPAPTPASAPALPMSGAEPAQPAPRLGADPLIAPEAAAQASASVSTLMRTLMSERQATVFRGGPTIEDLVREEIRPVLKEWLDTYLPDLVERLVRTEIERVVGRITG